MGKRKIIDRNLCFTPFYISVVSTLVLAPITGDSFNTDQQMFIEHLLCARFQAVSRVQFLSPGALGA